ncbi:MAG: VCBS repeat-containing protein [Anaerolineae bacterium]|nr:VCBS repeat-containing protein [Anaerolineae bacterium]
MNHRFIRRITLVLSGTIGRRPGKIALAASLWLCGALCLLFLQQAAPEPAYAWPGGDLSWAWDSPEGDSTFSVAWGDWDNDGDLDLAVGNGGCSESYYPPPPPCIPSPNQVYENTGDSLALAWSSSETDNTASVAWGDWDSDGDLDLAVGNKGHWDQGIYRRRPNRVYENTEGDLALAWSSPETDDTTSVAWGDWDGDGDLDLAVGKDGQPTQVYRNETKDTPGIPDSDRLSLAWSAPPTDTAHTTSVAWGDWDDDDDLDLAVGKDDQPNQVYRNETKDTPGIPDSDRLSLAWSAPPTDTAHTTSVAWGDWDGDDDLDIAVGKDGQPNQVYRNETKDTPGVPDSDRLSWAWSAPPTDTAHTTSVAWSDWDGDGDLDLAVGNGTIFTGQHNRVYRNDTTETPYVTDTKRLVAAWFSVETDKTASVAWGDWDDDGDLDLVVGNDGEPNRVYENLGASLSLATTLPPPELNCIESVAWGDWDDSGDLDLAVGGEFSGVYTNTEGSLALSSLVTASTASVAWGDWDGDGDLDLAAGARVYEHDQGALHLDPNQGYGWDGGGDGSSVAWGDWDGDGDLDLAVGNDGQPNQVYEYDGLSQTLKLDAYHSFGWSSLLTDSTTSVAWGDWDGDGDLDLAVGNYGSNRVYENLGTSLSLNATWSSMEVDWTTSVAWGDWDGDGDLDLAVGNDGQPNRVYENLGASLSLTATWSSLEADWTASVAWGDWDGDLDLDLAVGNRCLSLKPFVCRHDVLYENVGSDLKRVWSSPIVEPTSSVAWGDWDGDGDLDLAMGTRGNETYPTLQYVYVNHTQDILTTPDPLTWARITQPGGAAAPFFASATVLEGPTQTITYTLFDAEGDRAREVRAFYSLDGGGTWQRPVAFTGTITENLAAAPSPTGTVHTYTWDLYRSRFFGASDSVVFRLDVYQGFDGPGPYQYPLRTARTLPFRVRGSQVRVVDEDGEPVPDATVYHRANNPTSLFEPYQDDKGRPFRTNPAGYLLGYGEIAEGDQLVALVPISHTESYTLYYTTAAPSPTGLDAHPVTALGVQTLTVSADHPLYLFNLDLSLEWDARNDATFLEDLDLALQRASALFYDVTDGQAAIGRVHVYQDRENWLGADVVMYAQNGIRPRASMGGVAADLTDDFDRNGDLISNAYGPGQVRMGPNWDPFGQSLAELDTEWQRALAHELAHYLLFLPDNYLGVGDNGAPVSVDCKGSFMTSTYDDAYSELLPRNLWDEPDRGCEHTIAMSTTGRADWETVGRFYSAVYSPTTTFDGPSHLPLDITHVVQVPLSDTSQALPALVFDVRDEEYALLQVSGAQGFLFKTRGTPDDLSDDAVISLGQTVADGDRIKVRGAEPGDRLCILGPYDPTLPGTTSPLSGTLAGCIESLQNTDRAVRVSPAAGWRPNVVVTAITSRTLAVTATLAVAETGLNLQVLPTYGGLTATEPISAPWKLMTAVGPTPTLTFTASIILAEPCFELMVRVWVPGSRPPREALSPLYVSPPWGPDSPGVGGLNVPRAWGANKRQLGAPVASGDGGVTIWNVTDIFADTGTASLQAVHNLPGLAPWLAPVGPGYRFAAGDEPFPRAIAFNYLERNAPAGFEEALYVYYSPDDGANWQRLPTTRDTNHNQASAVMPDSPDTGYGEGLYALACTIDMPQFQPGWNLFGYPLQGSRSITEALASLDGFYTTVYDWQGTGPACYDCWHVYDATWDPAYNTVDTLAFGETYWIRVTEGITLSLRPVVDRAMAPQGSLLIPPATFYGPVAAGAGFTPAVGMVVTATVGNRVCGLGETLALDGQVVYRVSVLADEPGYAAGCGRPGSAVRFAIGGQPMACAGRWDNDAVQEHPLGVTCGTYLPVVTRSH